MRLGWRIGLFLVLTVALVLALGVGLARWGLEGAAAATLVGAVAGGAVALRLDGRRVGSLGFHLARSVPWEVTRGLGLGVALATVVVGGISLLGGVRWSVDDGSMLAWLSGALGAAAFLALPAAAEEALLRGYPLQALTEAWGGPWALVMTSVVFGAMHLGNPGATALGTTNTMAAGLFLGVLYLRTGSLWWTTGAHLGWNWGLGFLADLPVSGLVIADAPLLDARSAGPGWLGGGAFGPEGSVVATAGFLACAALCWWGPWLRPEPAALARRPLAWGRGTEQNKDHRAGGGAYFSRPEPDKEHVP
ncbi:MAG TPA: type II CAAX endopeptidase family protein [Longimicrobiales bacterium]|nr:type II CAAX endopeptidase family protein [Longimicrobiales bacterium]